MSTTDDRIPWVTWLSGGAAILVLVATGFVLLSPVPRPPTPPASASKPLAHSNSSDPAPSSPTTPQPKEPDSKRHPLDISGALVDARARASQRLESSALIGVRLIIDGGKPLGQLEVTYASARGRPLPGDPVTPKRLRIVYENKGHESSLDGQTASEIEETDRSPARVLPDPNCPLEAAFRAATQAGASESARLFAVYSHSARHQRPMWTLTAAEGAAYHVDASNCALIVR